VGTRERGNGAALDGRRRGLKSSKSGQTARELAKGIYRAARTQKLAREPVLRNQMMRAVVSISSNIAEGYERGTRKQQIEFLLHREGVGRRVA